jgi:hypothetical protein
MPLSCDCDYRERQNHHQARQDVVAGYSRISAYVEVTANPGISGTMDNRND